MLSRKEIEDCRKLIEQYQGFIDTHLYKHMHDEDVSPTEELCRTLIQRFDEELNEQGLE
jgi:hypothetical protein